MSFFKKKEKVNANSQNGANEDKIKVDTSTITTMVGVDTIVEGNLITKSSVRINGTVIGHVKADGVVVLTKTGVIEGTVEAESIIVAGVVRGNMSIRDKVNVEASGEIYGEIITKKFVIDEESIFQGNCVMNRDGKVIPVPEYLTEAEKKKIEETNKKIEEEVEKRVAEEKKKLKEEDKKESEEKSEDKDDTKGSDDKTDDANSENKDLVAKDNDSSDDADSKNDDEDSDDSDDSDEDGDESSDSEDSDDNSEKKDDDTIIIADINEVEAAEDIPASDGDMPKKKKGYVKTSKSLSVEIQEE